MTDRVSTQVNRAKLKHAAKLIASEVAFFNGWHVSYDVQMKACEKAAKKVMRYLKQRESGGHDD